jgi:hypothetical protein
MLEGVAAVRVTVSLGPAVVVIGKFARVWPAAM